MALSDYERNMLEQLEAQLQDEDPSFANSMKNDEAPTSVSRQLSVRHLVLGLLVLILGIVIMVWGGSLSWLWLGAIGVVVMFLGAWYVVSGFTVTEAAPGEKGANQPRKNPGGSSSFMDRQQSMWEKRRRGANGE